MTDLAMDYLGLDALLSAEEIAWRDTVREFVRDRIRPNISAVVREGSVSRRDRP